MAPWSGGGKLFRMATFSRDAVSADAGSPSRLLRWLEILAVCRREFWAKIVLTRISTGNHLSGRRS